LNEEIKKNEDDEFDQDIEEAADEMWESSLHAKRIV
jgi:hypothetical protein